MQELQPWLLPHPQPYDPSPPKVRKCPDSADRHQELAVPARHPCCRRGDLVHPGGVDLAEELEREVQPRLGDPRELRRLGAQRGRGGDDLQADVRREVDRQEEPEPGVRQAFPSWPRIARCIAPDR